MKTNPETTAAYATPVPATFIGPVLPFSLAAPILRRLADCVCSVGYGTWSGLVAQEFTSREPVCVVQFRRDEARMGWDLETAILFLESETTVRVQIVDGKFAGEVTRFSRLNASNVGNVADNLVGTFTDYAKR